mgnify:CR=1 FL=1
MVLNKIFGLGCGRTIKVLKVLQFALKFGICTEDTSIPHLEPGKVKTSRHHNNSVNTLMKLFFVIYDAFTVKYLSSRYSDGLPQYPLNII